MNSNHRGQRIINYNLPLALSVFLALPAMASPTDSHHDHAESTVQSPKVTSAPAPGTHQIKEPDEDTHKHKVDRAPASAAAPAAAEANHAAPAAAAAATPSHGHGEGGVKGEQSLQWLQNGNVRYLKRAFRADGRGAEDRKRLSTGQKPHAIVLSCSDSRVPPEIVFDQALGEIFVIRVAGEALDSSVVASIEYAIEHLGSRLLVVMGHSQCGAVKAALATKEGESAGSSDLDRLVGDIRPRLKTVAKEKPSTNFEVESAVNADGVARDLLKRSEIIRKKVEAGSLLIKTALYRIDTGKVSFY